MVTLYELSHEEHWVWVLPALRRIQQQSTNRWGDEAAALDWLLEQGAGEVHHAITAQRDRLSGAQARSLQTTRWITHDRDTNRLDGAEGATSWPNTISWANAAKQLHLPPLDYTVMLDAGNATRFIRRHLSRTQPTRLVISLSHAPTRYEPTTINGRLALTRTVTIDQLTSRFAIDPQHQPDPLNPTHRTSNDPPADARHLQQIKDELARFIAAQTTVRPIPTIELWNGLDRDQQRTPQSVLLPDNQSIREIVAHLQQHTATPPHPPQH